MISILSDKSLKTLILICISSFLNTDKNIFKKNEKYLLTNYLFVTIIVTYILSPCILLMVGDLKYPKTKN